MGGGGKSGGGGSTGPTYEQQQADYQRALDKQTADYALILEEQQYQNQQTIANNAAAQAKQLEDQRKANEISAAKTRISDLYSSKYSAADTATSLVDDQIKEELAHAKLIGLDYTLDPDLRQKRINDVFATKWSEADDLTLNNLTTTHGDQGFIWDVPIVRGDPNSAVIPQFTPGDKAGGKVKKTKGAKSTLEESPLGAVGVLG